MMMMMMMMDATTAVVVAQVVLVRDIHRPTRVDYCCYDDYSPRRGLANESSPTRQSFGPGHPIESMVVKVVMVLVLVLVLVVLALVVTLMLLLRLLMRKKQQKEEPEPTRVDIVGLARFE
jgi:hypothetical protein